MCALALIRVSFDSSGSRSPEFGAGLDVGSIEVQVGAGRGWAALVLVPGTVDSRAIRMFGGRAAPEQAKLADLHAGPELDRQRGHVRELECHMAGEAGVDPPGGRVRQ